MPANRIAALVGALVPILTAVGVLISDFESDVARAVVVSVALLALAAVVITYLIGSQRFDSLVMTAEPSTGPDRTEQTVEVDAGLSDPPGTTYAPDAPGQL